MEILEKAVERSPKCGWLSEGVMLGVGGWDGSGGHRFLVLPPGSRGCPERPHVGLWGWGPSLLTRGAPPVLSRCWTSPSPLLTDSKRLPCGGTWRPMTLGGQRAFFGEGFCSEESQPWDAHPTIHMGPGGSGGRRGPVSAKAPPAPP